MERTLYDALVADYPPIDLFLHLSKVGHKYVLSEKFNAANYQRFLEQTPSWKRFHDWIKSAKFIEAVDLMLREVSIDLGLPRMHPSLLKRWKRGWTDVKRGRFPRIPPGLRARFEFSMLPAAGGYILPHTDTPKKIVTLIVSSFKEGEWDPALGGSTEVLRPINTGDSYNWLNENIPFEEVETLDSYEFRPNQCLAFVKTFNSLHGVRPMKGTDSGLMRKTVTINIEHDV